MSTAVIYIILFLTMLCLLIRLKMHLRRKKMTIMMPPIRISLKGISPGPNESDVKVIKKGSDVIVTIEKKMLPKFAQRASGVFLYISRVRRFEAEQQRRGINILPILNDDELEWQYIIGPEYNVKAVKAQKIKHYHTIVIILSKILLIKAH